MERKSKSKLGRGMDALLGDYSLPEKSTSGKGTEVTLVNISHLQASIEQPRKRFPRQSLEELAKSIKEHGILQPILVQQKDGKYYIIAGERRFRAAKLAGLEKVPVISRTVDNESLRIISLIENIQREDLNPIEEAQAFQELLALKGMSQEQLSTQLGIARTTIANAVRLLKLSPEVQDAIVAETVSSGHARAILSVQNVSLHQKFLKKIISQAWSVRIAEKVAGRINLGQSIETAAKEVAEEQILEKESAGRSNIPTTPPAKTEIKTQNSDAELRKTEHSLVEFLGTKVRIVGSHTAGKLEIHYFSTEDLEMLIRMLLREK